MSCSHKSPEFLLDECRAKYSWTSGATRGTPSARSRYRKDLEIAFSEINGLMAGMHYQDEEESHRTAQGEYPDEISDDDLLIEKGTKEYCASPKSVGIMDDQPMASQWAAISSLKMETEYLYNRFLVLASRLKDPILSDLLNSYPSPRSIRTTGAQLFKDVLDGFQPQELSHVFAFTCFSYSISKVLYKKGCLDHGDILAGFQHWRNSILDKMEMQAFDRLAPELWPESKNHLHVNNTPEHPPRDPAVASDLSSDPAALADPVDLPASHLPFPQASGQPTADMNDPLSLAGLEGIDDIGPSSDFQGDVTISDSVVHQMNVAHENFDFSAIDLFGNFSQYQHPPDPGWLQQSEPRIPDPSPGRNFFVPNNSDPPVSKGEPSHTRGKPPQDALEETGTFLVVLVFFQEIGELLYALSRRTCLASRRHKLYGAQQKDQDAFYQSAMKTFFEPYYQGPASGTPAFMALLSVAEIFTKRGYIRSIAEIKHYLVTLAAAVLPPGAVFIQFISLVVSYSSSASTSPIIPTCNNSGKRKREADGESPPPEQVLPPKATKFVRKCEWEGCNNSYKDLSALRKHQVQSHIKPPPIPCGYAGCGYGNARRDRVRAHFLKQHRGVTLPELLSDTRRAVSVQPQLLD